MPKPRKPCKRCGKPKEKGQGHAICEKCRQKNRIEAEKRTQCSRCGAKKPPGRARRLCDDCAKESQRKFGRAKCPSCGGPKEPGKGRVLCVECAELVHWKYMRRRSNNAILRRRPCARCGGKKEPKGGRLYCVRCAQELQRERMKPCRRCGGPKEPGDRLLCQACITAPGYRKRNKRMPCVSCGGPKESIAEGGGCTLCKACRNDKKRKRELKRMAHRLEQERKGRRVEPISLVEYEKRYGSSRGHTQSIPCGPLIPELKRWIGNNDRMRADYIHSKTNREGKKVKKDKNKNNGAVKHLAELSGVSERRINDLTSGRQLTATQATIDRLCMAMDISMEALFSEEVAA